MSKMSTSPWKGGTNIVVTTGCHRHLARYTCAIHLGPGEDQAALTRETENDTDAK